jgi:hypothetical protein
MQLKRPDDVSLTSDSMFLSKGILPPVRSQFAVHLISLSLEIVEFFFNRRQKFTEFLLEEENKKVLITIQLVA